MFRELKFGGAGSTRLKAPESDFDKAAYSILIGLSAIISALFLPIHDFVLEKSGFNATGDLIATEEIARKGNRESVGIYEFSDQIGSRFHAKGKISFKSKNNIPKTARIAWKAGEPQNARVLYQSGFAPPVLIFGVLLTGFGVRKLLKIRNRKKSL